MFDLFTELRNALAVTRDTLINEKFRKVLSCSDGGGGMWNGSIFTGPFKNVLFRVKLHAPNWVMFRFDGRNKSQPIVIAAGGEHLVKMFQAGKRCIVRRQAPVMKVGSRFFAQQFVINIRWNVAEQAALFSS